MDIRFRSRYIKQYNKLQKKDKVAVSKAIDIFEDNPFDPVLRNHALKGGLSGYRSIDAGFDLRILFNEENGYEIVNIVQVGSHNQIY